MKPSIKSIHKRLEKLSVLSNSRYVLLNHKFTNRAVSVVEISREANENVFTRYETEILCKGYYGHFEFETYFIDGETAEFYGIVSDYYLCISYYL